MHAEILNMNMRDIISERENPPALKVLAGLFLLSFSTLYFEINLTRIYSFSQFYHYGFMIISLALLGYGASGTFLVITRKSRKTSGEGIIHYMTIFASLVIIGSYLIINLVQFDSYSIVVRPSQLLILFIHFIVLSLPFFFNGLAVGILLEKYDQWTSRVYAVNLIGSAFGCLGIVIFPNFIGAVGSIFISSGISAIASLVTYPYQQEDHRDSGLFSRGGTREYHLISFWIAIAILITAGFDIGTRYKSEKGIFDIFSLRISPYKSLSQITRFPDTEVEETEWNSYSRVDLIKSTHIHSIPGLSIRYRGELPLEKGVLINGDNLRPVISDLEEVEFSHYLPLSVAFEGLENPDVLILEPGGGIDILVVHSLGSRSITAVEPNQLIFNHTSHIYDHTKSEYYLETARAYMRHEPDKFDLIVFSLSNNFHPIRSGAYSLNEDYDRTFESIEEAYSHLEEDGIMLITNWLQIPPSEWLRMFGTVVQVIEKIDGDVSNQLVAFRSYNVGSILLKKGNFTETEINRIRKKTNLLGFDLVWIKDIKESDLNQFNILKEPIYHNLFVDLMSTEDREEWYENYEYDVNPVTDDQPFSGNYFRWSHLRILLNEYGKTWQPFGGAGIIALLIFLLLTLIACISIIFLPVLFTSLKSRRISNETTKRIKYSELRLVYFALIGLGFMMFEIPVFQKMILFLGKPSLSLVVVLFSILLSSGIGSYFSTRIKHKVSLGLLVILLFSYPPLMELLIDWGFKFEFEIRAGLVFIFLAPIGFLLGNQFPKGLVSLLEGEKGLIPWAWAVNGSTSVVGSTIATIIAVSSGFNWVLLIGGCCYGLAFMVVFLLKNHANLPPHQ